MGHGASHVDKIVGAMRTPSEHGYSLPDSTREKVIDTLGHYRYAMARVQLEESSDEDNRTVQAIYQVNAGNAVAIGRIQFNGNSRLPGRFLRRELQAGEGEVFDTVNLGQSLERLNKSNQLEEVRRTDVSLKFNEETKLLDVSFKVTE